ncbi:MAG: FtsX-like permease family protein, partial [Verrucomicrobiae bacterium]|nr:FtsX-like permease family protein [Verrucomicrobiae bacterium]
QARDQASYDDCVEQVRGILRMARRVPPTEPDDFEISSNDSLIRQFRSLTFAVRVGVAVISSIALMAAGIGIMNIMLASINERIREIGIRKAIGATDTSIFIQILIESAVIALVGGIAGLIAAQGFVKLLASVTPTGNTPVVTFSAMAIAFTFSLLTGIVAGLFPAFKAARLEPIRALRLD